MTLAYFEYEIQDFLIMHYDRFSLLAKAAGPGWASIWQLVSSSGAWLTPVARLLSGTATQEVDSPWPQASPN